MRFSQKIFFSPHDDFSNNNCSEEANPMKRVKRERSTGSVDSNASASLIDEPEEWPFQNFCEVLISDLFHSSWEVRHGAGCGLREIVKLHGQGAGKTVDTPNNQVFIHRLCFTLNDLSII
ncbi:BTAF1 RNA polymerase II, B-TFIID transcription factor-associated [Elysia marginata]|uniref:BTAF1 RNA polymerase II, B-TFIID transcription factor-associated n=1 Tax=Elysia marginata TaxID=1093978 RepID=A0AAV4ES22_9GAST|nr:BTAF1 RNA polymerase II, B-TFIID transcription factor-associated [Elysia marginata]